MDTEIVSVANGVFVDLEQLYFSSIYVWAECERDPKIPLLRLM